MRLVWWVRLVFWLRGIRIVMKPERSEEISICACEYCQHLRAKRSGRAA